MSSSKKLYKIIERGGLHNMLLGFMYSMVYAHYSNRDLCIPKFKTQFLSDDFMNFEEVIDIDEFHKLMDKYHITSRIIPEPSIEFTRSRYHSSRSSGTAESFINKFRNEPEEYIDLGITFNWNITGFLEPLSYRLIPQIIFTDRFYQIAKNIGQPKNILPFT